MRTMFAISVVLLFLLSVAGAAFAAGNAGTYQGQVSAINTEQGTIALKTFQPAVSPSDTPGFVFKTR
ncbi:MAG: hypothetical protein P8013_14465 [Candidatus Sulfobium sp.]|jgi:predicted S18 family serine protease